MLDGAMAVWFVLTFGSVAFVVFDSLFNTPTSSIQQVAWILVTLYTGPIGCFFYLLACRRPIPGTHDAFTKATWKQGLNSEMHCLAGDATGILIAATFVAPLHLPHGIDIIIEYAAGFICGLFIFQALMMRGMYNGNYLLAVRKTFFAETVSMNMVMVGMIPTMVLLMPLMEGSGDPSNAAFWFRMSLSAVAGGITAFPINVWLVKNHLKHGCMTLPGKDGPAPDRGHRSEEPSAMVMDHEGMAGMKDHDMGSMKDHDMGSMKDMKQGEAMGEGGGMSMRSLSFGSSLVWILGTLLLFAIATWLTSLKVPIPFSS